MFSSPSPSITTITPETKSASDYIQEHSEKQTCEDQYETTSDCTTSTIEFDDKILIRTWYSNKRFFVESDDISLISGISIYSADGKLISNFEIDGSIKSFPMNAKNGIYFTSIQTKKGLFSGSFIIAE
ncbi:MAG: T9SS type A sorting domain-containing protein [Saprospiraceae bacterium]